MSDNTEPKLDEKEEKGREEAILQEAYNAMMKLSVPEWITWFIGHLSQLAWQYIGLMENPVSKKVEKDFEQAELAIDTINILMEKVKNKLPDDTGKELQGLVANLQVNFVKQRAKEN